jgi:nucleotide-binding universal stress UspA family protein
MKILIPVDFSDTSLQAMDYGISLAKAFKGEVKILNVVHFEGPPRANVNMKEIKDVMMADAKEEFTKLQDGNHKKHGDEIKISYEVMSGHSVLYGIEKLIENEHYEFVVMGTSGASGLKKFLIGSNAADMVMNSPIPVLIIPNGVKFEKIETILYPTDFLNTEAELKKIISVAKIYNAKINLLHIDSEFKENKEELNRIKNEIIVDQNYPFIEFIIYNPTEGETLKQSIDKHVVSTEADWVTMFTHKLSIWEKITGKGNTREMAMDSQVPLLAFRK